MQAKIEPVGDQFGLLLPKEILQACGLGDEVNVTLEDRKLIVSAASRPTRDGWAEAIAAIPQESLDRDQAEMAVMEAMPDDWDKTEWQWPETPDDEAV